MLYSTIFLYTCYNVFQFVFLFDIFSSYSFVFFIKSSFLSPLGHAQLCCAVCYPQWTFTLLPPLHPLSSDLQTLNHTDMWVLNPTDLLIQNHTDKAYISEVCHTGSSKLTPLSIPSTSGASRDQSHPDG